jgi:hypothetical protein
LLAKNQDASREFLVELSFVGHVLGSHGVIWCNGRQVAVLLCCLDCSVVETFLLFGSKCLVLTVPGGKLSSRFFAVEASECFFWMVISNVFADAVVFKSLFKFGQSRVAYWADPCFESVG